MKLSINLMNIRTTVGSNPGFKTKVNNALSEI